MLLCGVPASAQGLRSLHVETLSQTLDRAQVAVGDDFQLTIHAHVDERIAALDELVIPDVGALHVMGDERHVSHRHGGTDVDEVLTLEAPEPGFVAIPGASLDAIDARTGKPTRFTANAVHLRVGAPPPAEKAWRIIAAIVAAALAIALGTLAAIRVLGRRTGPSTPAAPSPRIDTVATANGAPRTPRDAVAAALFAYRAQPSPESLRALRAALYRASGLPDGATLGDVVRASGDVRLVETLRVADAAVFGPSTNVAEHATAESAIAASVERWLT